MLSPSEPAGHRESRGSASMISPSATNTVSSTRANVAVGENGPREGACGIEGGVGGRCCMMVAANFLAPPQRSLAP